MISTRVKVIGLLITALALGLVVAPAVAFGTGPEESSTGTEAVANPLEVEPLAEESCETGWVCVWPRAEFQGARGMTFCGNSGVHELAGGKDSLKNRCENKKVETGTGECVNPGGNIARSFLGFSVIFVGGEGSRC
jgi:hypothetical protein